MKAVEEPKRIAQLPHHNVGNVVRPVPWFVAWFDGEPDFRVGSQEKLLRAIEPGHERCWTCGGKMKGAGAFVIGPMCAVNRVSAEPPSHIECARYSVQACPFLVNPKKRRREGALPEEEAFVTGGEMIRRNPGVSLLWAGRHWRRINDGRGGILFDVGAPSRVEWWCEGREATREEVMASIDSGLPELAKIAKQESPEAEAHLLACLNRALELVPV